MRECSQCPEPETDDSVIECDGIYTSSNCVEVPAIPYLGVGENSSLTTFIDKVVGRLKKVVNSRSCCDGQSSYTYEYKDNCEGGGLKITDNTGAVVFDKCFDCCGGGDVYEPLDVTFENNSDCIKIIGEAIVTGGSGNYTYEWNYLVGSVNRIGSLSPTIYPYPFAPESFFTSNFNGVGYSTFTGQGTNIIEMEILQINGEVVGNYSGTTVEFILTIRDSVSKQEITRFARFSQQFC